MCEKSSTSGSEIKENIIRKIFYRKRHRNSEKNHEGGCKK
jgi:hypothetical protein